MAGRIGAGVAGEGGQDLVGHRPIAILAGQVPEHRRDLGQRAVGRGGRPVMGVLRPHDRPIRRGGAEEEAAVLAIVEVATCSARPMPRA